MSYELRIGGRFEARFEDVSEVETKARALIRKDADTIVEIIDLSTGRPYAPAADAQEREAMARKIGF
jgi:hypothetical protein